MSALHRIVPPEAAEAIGSAIQRRSDGRMPGNPFPPDSPWGRELDRMHAEDQAARKFRRDYGIDLRRGSRAAR